MPARAAGGDQRPAALAVHRKYIKSSRADAAQRLYKSRTESGLMRFGESAAEVRGKGGRKVSEKCKSAAGLMIRPKLK
jgi:hypothetical protein